MHFVKILKSKSKQRSSKNFNEIAFIFRHPSMRNLTHRREMTAFTKILQIIRNRILA